MTRRPFNFDPDRRILLRAGLAGGAVAWAGASVWSGGRAAERPRLAVLFMQGGMDGLSVAPPLNDERYAVLRGPLAIPQPLPFAADFGLHPALSRLAGMAREGQVRLAPAAAAPTRSRSHFNEADVLGSGFTDGRGPASGWLNRAVSLLGAGGDLPAVSLDAAASAAVAGSTLFGSWSPGAPSLDRELAGRLRELYRDDPQLRSLLVSAERMQRRAEAASQGPPASPAVLRARTLGRLFDQADGPAVGYLSLGGFDTHERQGGATGKLADRLSELDQVIAALREGAGPAWRRTIAIVYTEFGRTAAANGAGGTDHGIASTALVIGGALKAGGPIGDWPGLAGGRLYEGRDVAPALDLYALFKGVLSEHWGLSRAQLDDVVFPSSTRSRAVTGLVS